MISLVELGSIAKDHCGPGGTTLITRVACGAHHMLLLRPSRTRTCDPLVKRAAKSIPSSNGSLDLLTFFTGCSRFGVHLVTTIHICLPVFMSQICHRSGRLLPGASVIFFGAWICSRRQLKSGSSVKIRKGPLFSMLHLGAPYVACMSLVVPQGLSVSTNRLSN